MSECETGYCRRELLQRAAGGFASIALAGILADRQAAGARAATTADDPLAPKRPHIPPRAQRVIFLYMTGGVSHVDTFDPKPRLISGHGKIDHRRQLAGEGRPVQALSQAPTVEVSPGRRVRHGDQRSFSARARRRRRTVRHPFHGVQSHESLRGDSGHPHRLVDVCPAEHRRVGQLRTGNGESESAVVRRTGTARAVRRCTNLGLRFSARLPSGAASRSRPHSHSERATSRLLRSTPTPRTGDGGVGQRPPSAGTSAGCCARCSNPLDGNGLRHATGRPRSVRRRARNAPPRTPRMASTAGP